MFIACYKTDLFAKLTDNYLFSSTPKIARVWSVTILTSEREGSTIDCLFHGRNDLIQVLHAFSARIACGTLRNDF